MPKEKLLVSSERIISRIFVIRGKKIILDRDLADLYQVDTRNLNKAVKRNIERFPDDFMFQLTRKEFLDLMFQFGTSSWGGNRKLPFAFTEYGVAMLSGVLNSERAIKVNIQIIRIFTRLRNFLIHYKDLKEKIEKMERKYDKQFRIVFEAIKQLIQEEEKPKKIMGFSDKK